MMEGKVVMETVPKPHIVQTSGNGGGTPPLAERGQLSPEEVSALIEVTARELLGVSADDAFAKLDRGELDGTLAGGTLESLRWLLAA
jgi:hypothetical protein